MGAIAGAVLTNVMFELPAVQVAETARSSTGLWVGEVVATAGLIAVIFALARGGCPALSAVTVASYIAAAYSFTSSTSFANPAVTIGRAFTDTFAGIAPASLAGFVVAQLAGLIAGVAMLAALYPAAGDAAGDVVVEHDHLQGATRD